MKFIPAAITPIFWRDVLLAAISKNEDIDCFEAELASYFSQSNAYTFTSLMRTVYACFYALRSSNIKRVVILPRYSCPSFAHGVLAAGLEIQYCDVDPLTLAIDMESLSRCDLSRALALVCTNLFGFTSSIETLLNIGRAHDIHIIEGVDYGIGTEYKCKRIGAWSDITILNFQEGKVIPIGGGAIVSSLPIFEKKFGGKRKTRFPNYVTMLGFSIFSRPVMYFLFMKFSKLLRFERKSFSMEDTIRKTSHETDFIFDEEGFDRRLSNFQGRLGLRVMRRLEHDLLYRYEIATLLKLALCKLPDIHVITKIDGVGKVHYIRFPILVSNNKRNIILEELLSVGIEASPMYVEYGMQVDPYYFPGSARVAHELLTLPCHPYMGIDDVNHIIRIFKSHFSRTA